MIVKLILSIFVFPGQRAIRVPPDFAEFEGRRIVRKLDETKNLKNQLTNQSFWNEL